MRQAFVKLGFLVHDVSRMRRTFFDQALKPLGITRSQWWALVNISRHADIGMIQTELARMLETGKVTVGGLIDRLEATGLVYRKSDAEDRRVKRIYITEKGYDVLEHVKRVADKIDDILHDDIAEEDLNTATEVLARMKHNLRLALRNPPTIEPMTKKRRATRRSFARGDKLTAE
jgi:MarR family transcriptional regulator for hemolysin